MNAMKKLLSALATAAVAGFVFASVAAANPLYDAAVIEPANAPAASVMVEKSAPAIKRGQIVNVALNKKPGSIVVNSKTNKLYLVLADGKAVMYRVATAKSGFEWKGTHKVSAKSQWPDWRPPAEMRQRRPDLPAFMEGGPRNPLGARALYLGSTIYRIHGTNEPRSIGKAASSGCIRMLNSDVTELYSLVKLGAEVTVL
jgi:lipoprotein-anchoring transpeptidase ErfK/SrfK